MSKRNLLKKMTKVASVALVAGAMVCGASLTNVNAQSVKPNKDAQAEKSMTKKGLFGYTRKGVKANKKSAKKNKKNVRKNVKHAKKAASKKSSKKAAKKSAKKNSKVAKKGVKKASNNRKASKKSVKNTRKGKKANKHAKKAAKKSAKKGSKLAKKATNKRNRKVAKKSSKKAAKKASVKRARKAAAKKAALKRAKRLARRNRAEEPMNRRGYRHANKRNASAKRVHAFRKSAYYRNTWSNALKINKKGIRKDEKAKKFDQKRGYKYAAKYLQGKINYLNGYVRHDAHMLSLR